MPGSPHRYAITLYHLIAEVTSLVCAMLTRSQDIKTDNILQEIEDESILTDFEKAEFEHPSPRKVDGDRTIYTTRRLGFPKTAGHPVLSDFGSARFGNVVNNDDIQPELYRAPEVILELKWSYSVDIWNVGVMVRSSEYSLFSSCIFLYNVPISTALLTPAMNKLS